MSHPIDRGATVNRDRTGREEFLDNMAVMHLASMPAPSRKTFENIRATLHDRLESGTLFPEISSKPIKDKEGREVGRTIEVVGDTEK